MPRHRHDPAASRKYHNRVARQYDNIYDDPYWEFHDEITWRAIKPHLPRDASAACLDLGCGTGKWGLKLLKSGFATTFLDHSPNMIERTREKVDAMGPRAKHATLIVADIVDLSVLSEAHYALTLAMGDPLSICSDHARAARQMFRICRPGGIVIATADNLFAAIDHFLDKRDISGLENLVRTERTHWLTDEQSEQFELIMFTPATLRKCFESAGFEILSLTGKTILPIRKHKELLADPEATERLLRIEHDLAKDSTSAARASHLQVLARRPA